jgi:hypothetical protein
MIHRYRVDNAKLPKVVFEGGVVAVPSCKVKKKERRKKRFVGS